MSLKVSVYVPSLWYFLNMSPFPQGGHCHLSRLTSPSHAPLLLVRHPSITTFAVLSVTFLAGIYWWTSLDLSLLDHLLRLCAAFWRYMMMMIGELNCHHIL